MSNTIIEVDQAFIDAMEEHRKPNKENGLLKESSENVVVFASHMLGLRLYSWQVYFLKHIEEAMGDPEARREYVAITSRQIGKSTSLAILALWACTFNKYPGTISNNTVFGIASASDTQAKKLLNEINKLTRIGNRYMRDTYRDEDDKPLFGEEFFTDLIDVKEANNTTTITFKSYDESVHGEFLLKDSRSGSLIKSYPPTSVVLGETFTVVVIDEAGKSDKLTDQFFYDFMYPTGNSTNAVRIYTSTPWTSSGFFYRMVDPDDIYEESPAFVVSFTVEAIKLENPDYYKSIMKIVDSLNADGKTDEVQRAYYCRFVKGTKNYFNPDRVLEAFTSTYEPEYSYTGMCDMGIDFGGQTTSKTVITISELKDDGTVRRLYHQVYGVGEDNNLIDDVKELKKRFNIQRIIPDDCPQGDYLIRQMRDMGWDINPMNFRTDKVAKYGAFRSKLNHNKVISYLDDDLKTEMLALEWAEGARQSKIQHAPGYSDDRIDSWILSAYFFLTEEETVKFFDMDSLDETEKCPNCGSTNIVRDEKDKHTELHCRTCKHTWVNSSGTIYDTAELLYSG